MKVCIQIDQSFDSFLDKVGQLNNSSCGKICRLIVEHQLTYYIQKNLIPMFYSGVFATFQKSDFVKKDSEKNGSGNHDSEATETVVSVNYIKTPEEIFGPDPEPVDPLAFMEDE